MRAAPISSALEDIPVDFFADPDGCWEYDELVHVAGFEQAWGQLSIGALTEPYSGFPEGAAVVLFSNAEECAITLVDCLVNSPQSAASRAAVSQSAVSQSAVSQSAVSQSAANDDRRELSELPWNDARSGLYEQAHGGSSRAPSTHVLEERSDVAA
jgi:hypothetical protein